VTTHAAVDFVVAQLVDEAARRGITLSDVERQVLYFTESEHTPRRMIELMEAFERDYDEAAYERKIADLLRGAYKHTRSNQKEAWASALHRIRNSDVYLGVMLDQADLLRPPGDIWRLFATGILVSALGMGSLLVTAWLFGRTGRSDDSAFYLWFTTLCGAVGYTVARWIFGADAVDRFVDRVITLVTFGGLGNRRG
jgi:hypothetical protein